MRVRMRVRVCACVRACVRGLRLRARVHARVRVRARLLSRARARVHRLRADDKDILWEGLHTLSEAELTADLRARGLPTSKLDVEQMRSALDDWLKLSQVKEVRSACPTAAEPSLLDPAC